MTQSPPSTARTGFRGAIGSLPLVDLLQVWSLNRFSGLVAVVSQGRAGQLYFVDGQIVHAESAGLTGEPAVQAIIAWPEGAFELFPNTATLHRSIQKSFSHLLLEAHRVLDEQRRARGPGEAQPAAAPPPPRPSAIDQVRALPGVARVVRFGSEGRPVAREGPEDDQLAARALYLAANHAAAVASGLGLGELAVAALQGEREAFVVVHRAGNYLAVALQPGASAAEVAGQLRALLTRPATS